MNCVKMDQANELKNKLTMAHQSKRRSYLIALLLILITSLVFIGGHLYKPWCFAIECCNERWIPRDYKAVHKSLQENVFGQPLVQAVVSSSLEGHFSHQSPKPLVLSFHGSVGTGKTFVSQWIAKGWFRKGMESKFVHTFSATKDFPHKSDFKSYLDFLHREITSHTRSCGHQIFIFEEVDSFPSYLLPSIRHFLEYHETVDGIDYRNTTFIFLSNTGMIPLKRITEEFYAKKKDRKSIQLAETEEAMSLDIFGTKGETNDRLVDRNLISHLVPFFPLEKRHVRNCIEAAVKVRRITYDSKLIDDVMDELAFGGPDENFSSKGCKNVDEKLNFVLSSLRSTSKQEL